MTFSHLFLEGSTAKAVIQVADPWFWGGQSPEIVLSTHSE